MDVDTLTSTPRNSAQEIRESANRRLAEREAAHAAMESDFAAAVGALNVSWGRVVELTADLASSGEWSAYWGVRSLAHWLRWQLGVSPSTAKNLIAVAEARETHPVTTQLLVDGKLTLDQTVAAVAAPAHCDEAIAELAQISTVTQIRAEARHANLSSPAPADDDTGESADEELPDWAKPEAPSAKPERVGRGVDEVGLSGWLSATLDIDRWQVVNSALDESRDRLAREGNADATMADALVDIARRSLAASPEQRQANFRINVFVDTAGDPHRVVGRFVDRTTMPDELFRLLACDGHLSVFERDQGVPVNVGRTQRIVPERTRRVVLHRDGGACVNPACNSPHGLEIHHLVHWIDGGTTDTNNLVTLCAACHRLHHRGRLEFVGNPDDPATFTVVDHDGRSLEPRIRPRPPTTPPEPPVIRYVHPLGESFSMSDLGTWPRPPDPN